MRGARGRRGRHPDGSDVVDLSSSSLSSSPLSSSVPLHEERGKRGKRGQRGGQRGGQRESLLREVLSPDRENHEASLRLVDSSLMSLKREIEALTVRIEERARERRGQRELVKVREGEKEAKKREKLRHFEEYERLLHVSEEREIRFDEVRREVEAKRRELSCFSVSECDAQMKAFDRQLLSRTLVPAQERQVLESMKKLRQERPRIQEFERRSKEALNPPDLSAINAERDAEFKLGHEAKEEEEKANQLLQVEVKKEQALTTQIDELIAQRRSLLNDRTRIERERLVIEDEYNLQTKAYEAYVREKEWRDNEIQQQQEYEARQARRERYEHQKAEREARDREYHERRALQEAQRDPYEKEKNACEELNRYLAALALRYGNETGDEEPQESVAETSEREKSMTSSLESRSSQFQAKAATPIESNKSNKQSMMPTNMAKGKSKKAGPKLLTHIPEMLGYFKIVGLTSPVLSSDLPSCIQALKKRQQLYETESEAALSSKTNQDAENPQGQDLNGTDSSDVTSQEANETNLTPMK